MGSAWLVVENFIKFLPGTPFQGTLPRKPVKMLGCSAWDIDLCSGWSLAYPHFSSEVPSGKLSVAGSSGGRVRPISKGREEGCTQMFLSRA